MSDYDNTRSVAGMVISRFEDVLKNLEDDYEEEIVVSSLVKYYHLCSKPTKIDNTRGEYVEPDEDLLWAIERVLKDYMTPEEFSKWQRNRR